MTSRHERRVPYGAGNASGNTDIDDAVAAIAVLQSLVIRQEVLRHPKIRVAVQELLELVALFLGQVDPEPGRHRAETVPTGLSVADIPVHTSTSVLEAVNTTAGFMEALRQYRFSAGDPSWRMIADRAGVAAHSTLYNAANGPTLPRPDVVRKIILGCGGSEEDQMAFLRARERIAAGRSRHRPVEAGSLL
jgi:hypothetical protein